MAGPGRFIWYDLMTIELENSLVFLTELLNLSVTEARIGEDGQYFMCTPKDVPEALFGAIPIIKDEGVQSHWLGYLAVDDFAGALDFVRDNGGDVHVTPDDYESVDEDDDEPLVTGHFGVVTDPQGAVFAPYAGAEEEPAEGAGVVPPGRIGWYELLTDDVDGACKWYQELFGWEVGPPIDRGEEGIAHALARGGRVFGMIRPRLAGDSFPPRWVYYFRVDDIDAAVARVRDLGGFVYEDPAPLDDGRRASLIDPTGAPVGIWQPG
ncbi:MAG: VOC family protein [Deltaproteobacteria bacterium]|nr:MAG: VOC family protein [Deltaproteobacteria bacterium]